MAAGASSVADCDRALVILHAALAETRMQAELVQLSIDRILDRRNELMEASRMGAQS